MISDLGNHNSIYLAVKIRTAGVRSCPTGSKASANSFDGPEICVASNSAKQMALRRLKHSKKIHNGYDVVNSLFTTDSAPELSLQDEIRILKRRDGDIREATNNNANWRELHNRKCHAACHQKQ